MQQLHTKKIPILISRHYTTFIKKHENFELHQYVNIESIDFFQKTAVQSTC